MLRYLVVFLLSLLLWPAVALAETPAEYYGALAETFIAAGAAINKLPPGSSLSEYKPLESSLQRLESIRTVKTDSGTAVAVDNGSLIKQFRGNWKEGHQAYESLHQLLLEFDASSRKAAPVAYGDARASLEEVLQRPEFNHTSANPIGNFFQDLRSRLVEWLNNLLPDLHLPQIPGLDPSGPFTIIFWLIAVTLASLTVLFLAYTIRNTRPRMVRYASLRDANAGQGHQREDAATVRQLAQRAADNGDYRLAIHYLFLLAILHLAEQSHLRYDRSLTNREQIRSLSTSSEVADLMRAVVEAFDRLWYGHATCTETEYRQFQNTIERIVEARV